MKIWASKTVEKNFTNKELKVLIEASLTDNRYEEATDILQKKFGGEGYMSGEAISEAACEYNEKYRYIEGFGDIEW